MRARRATRTCGWASLRRTSTENLGLLELLRLFGGGLAVLGLLVLTAPATRADDCASLSDCFATVSTAAQVIAGVAVLVAASALALPSILRATRGPSEISEAGVDTQVSGQGQGGIAQGAGPTQPQNVPGHQQAQQSGTGVGASQGINQGASPGGNQGGLNLPNLPDTPDVPLTPELSGAVGQGEARSGRDFSPAALEQMRTLGVSADDVEQVIQSGTTTAGSEPGTTVYTVPDAHLLVVVEAMTGRVVAVERA